MNRPSAVGTVPAAPAKRPLSPRFRPNAQVHFHEEGSDLSDNLNLIQLRRPEAVSFEVQVFTGGKWVTELVLDDRKEAEEEATRRMQARPRPLGTCVVREAVDEETGRITTTTVFRRGRPDHLSVVGQDDNREELAAELAEMSAQPRVAEVPPEPAEPDLPAPVSVPGADSVPEPEPAVRRLPWTRFPTLLRLPAVFFK
jgi:hypothetical protein